MKLTIELDREAGGRWIATVPESAGASKHGKTREEAIHAVRVLALQVVADMLEHGERPNVDCIEFTSAPGPHAP